MGLKMSSNALLLSLFLLLLCLFSEIGGSETTHWKIGQCLPISHNSSSYQWIFFSPKPNLAYLRIWLFLETNYNRRISNSALFLLLLYCIK